MTYSRIIGTGSYLPEKILTNFDLEKMVDTSNDWIVERTGIERRHIAAEDETTRTMAERAAQKALEMADIPSSEIDLIIVGTCTPERVFPSTACFLQSSLNITKNIPAFDLSAACAGFLYALSVADQYIKTGAVKTALVVGSEVLSRVTNWKERETCVLFGDGAGAVLLQANDEPGIYGTHIYAQGACSDLLFLPNKTAAPHVEPDASHIYMKGRDVFKMAVTALEDCAKTALEAHGFTASDVDWLIPHQANMRIIKSVAKRLDLPDEKIILTIDEHANTSSASIPLALDTGIRDGRIKRGDNLLLEAIGGGMAWGSAFIRY